VAATSFAPAPTYNCSKSFDVTCRNYIFVVSTLLKRLFNHPLLIIVVAYVTLFHLFGDTTKNKVRKRDSFATYQCHFATKNDSSIPNHCKYILNRKPLFVHYL